MACSPRAAMVRRTPQGGECKKYAQEVEEGAVIWNMGSSHTCHKLALVGRSTRKISNEVAHLWVHTTPTIAPGSQRGLITNKYTAVLTEFPFHNALAVKYTCDLGLKRPIVANFDVC